MPEFMGTKTMSVYDEGTILNEDGTVIAEFFEAEYVANARAFAAVPEMIVTLENIANVSNDVNIREYARAALAKALGEDGE